MRGREHLCVCVRTLREIGDALLILCRNLGIHFRKWICISSSIDLDVSVCPFVEYELSDLTENKRIINILLYLIFFNTFSLYSIYRKKYYKSISFSSKDKYCLVHLCEGEYMWWVACAGHLFACLARFLAPLCSARGAPFRSHNPQINMTFLQAQTCVHMGPKVNRTTRN